MPRKTMTKDDDKKIDAITDAQILHAAADEYQRSLLRDVMEMRNQCWKLASQVEASGDILDLTLREWGWSRLKKAKGAETENEPQRQDH